MVCQAGGLEFFEILNYVRQQNRFLDRRMCKFVHFVDWRSNGTHARDTFAEFDVLIIFYAAGNMKEIKNVGNGALTKWLGPKGILKRHSKIISSMKFLFFFFFIHKFEEQKK